MKGDLGVPNSLFSLSQARGIAIGLHLTSLQTHLVRVAAHMAGVDPAEYSRRALREQLERDLGREEVELRWTP